MKYIVSGSSELPLRGEVIVYIGQNINEPPYLKYGDKVIFHQQWLKVGTLGVKQHRTMYQVGREVHPQRFELLDDLFIPELFISLSEWRSKKINIILDNEKG
jgi:hypothetical protein